MAITPNRGPNLGLNPGPILVHCNTYESACQVSGRNVCQRNRPVPITHICYSVLWKVWNSSQLLRLGSCMGQTHAAHGTEKNQGGKKIVCTCWVFHVSAWAWQCREKHTHICVCQSFKHLEWKTVETWVTAGTEKAWYCSSSRRKICKKHISKKLRLQFDEKQQLAKSPTVHYTDKGLWTADHHVHMCWTCGPCMLL